LSASEIVSLLARAAFLAVAGFCFGVLLKLSDLLQEHGYRWFRGGATVTGTMCGGLLLVQIHQGGDLVRTFWWVVLLHWVLRGRIDGVNHGVPTVMGLSALAFRWPTALFDHPWPSLYFAVPFTALGLLHDASQYGAMKGPPWLSRFLENQHLYWYLVIVGHPLVARFDAVFLVSALAFVKGYGLLYTPRGLALLPRIGVRVSPRGEAP